MSTPTEKVKLYYKIVKDNPLKRLTRYLAAKLGYICLPARYIICLEKCAEDATKTAQRRNPLKAIQLQSKAKAYTEIAEEIKAFQNYKTD